MFNLTATAITPSCTARKVPAMNALETYNHLKTLNLKAVKAFLLMYVPVEQLQLIESYADFDENSELAFEIFNVRVPA
jgi:hypothetical protein